MSGAILGVDLGTVRIGIAICEAPELPAMPLTTIAHESTAADAARIVALAHERRATTIAVGYPLRLDGTPGPAAQKVERFIERLRAAFSGDVVKVDERLTTAAAEKKLRDSALSGSKKRRIVDRLAIAKA